MSDLVERLRCGHPPVWVVMQAADELERLQALLAEALPIVVETQTWEGVWVDTPDKLIGRMQAAIKGEA